MNCGYGDGCINGAAGIAVAIEAPDTQKSILHENIQISNNTIIGSPKNKCGIALGNARNIKLTNNHSEGCQNNITIGVTQDVNIESGNL